MNFMTDVINNLDVDVILEDSQATNDVNINVMAAQEHVSDVERCIRVIKERYRCLWHRLPYKAMPKVMIQEAAKHVVKWSNAFPPKGGISTEYSPIIIMGYTPIDYNKHCKLSFGSYCQKHQSDPTNTPKPRTIGSIYLGPTENVQGGHKVMNLATGKVITRHHATDIPITKDVVDRIEYMAEKDEIKPDTNSRKD